MDSSQAGRESQVKAQLTKLEKAIEALGGTITSLENRLHLVLRDTDKVMADSTKVPTETLVSLASEILDHAERVQELDARLDEMVRRLEL